MIETLSNLVPAKYPRPATFSNSALDSELANILAKADGDLKGDDFKAILNVSAPAGTYEERVYFMPLVMRHCQQRYDVGCVGPLIYFVSSEFDRLKDDGLAEEVVGAWREMFDHWTAYFRVDYYYNRSYPYERAAWNRVISSALVQSFIDHLLQYQTFAKLAEELIEGLALQDDHDVHSAWFLEYAHASRMSYQRWLQTRVQIRTIMKALFPGRAPADDSPPCSRSAHLVRLMNDDGLIRRHYERIRPTLVAQEPSPTYWPMVAKLLDHPGARLPSRVPGSAARFLPDEARPYTPPAKTTTAEPAGADLTGTIWEKTQQRTAWQMASLAQSAPAGAETFRELEILWRGLCAMPQIFRGSLRGFEGTLTIRVLLLSGEGALCEIANQLSYISIKALEAALKTEDLVEVRAMAEVHEPGTST